MDSSSEEEDEVPVMYVCVARGEVIISQFLDDDPALAAAAAESLGLLPKLHKRFTFASNNYMACYSITPALTFCGIFDESFGRNEGFVFLKRVEDEFRRMLLLRGFEGDAADIPLENMPADGDFLPVLRSMVNAANGDESDEESSDDDSAPLTRGVSRLPGSFPFGFLTRVKSNDDHGQTSPSSSSKKVMVKSSGSSSEMMWCNIIVAVYLLVCIVLGIYWLVSCRDFTCSS